ITVTEEMLFMNDAGTDGEFNADTVYRNFEYYSFDLGDIYMNINNQGYIDLDIGEVKALNMFRNWQAINSFTNDKIAIPNFEYEIINIEGDNVVSIVPDANNTGAATMTATGEGTAIVLVTYDAMYSEITATGSLGGAGGANRLSAIWPDRTGVFVVSVGKDGTAIQSNMTCNGAIFDAEHSPQFYHGEEGAVVSFTPEEGVTVTVNRSTVGEKKLSFGTFTSEGVSVNAETGEVTVSGLTTGRHIIRLEKDGVAAYQVVTATQTTVTMTDSEGNALSLNEKLQPGQTVEITVSGLTNPAEKFATKYNFNCQITYTDQLGNAYSNSSGATYGKYDFSSIPQVITVTIPEDWDQETLTLNGFMKMGGFAGDGIGSHRKVSYGDSRGMAWGSDAGMELGTLPEIVLNVALPHEHSYNAAVTAPTCTEGGFTTYTCTICGDSYIADETAALGHTEEIIPAVESTCTETGLTEGRKCAVCGEILVAQEVVPALGHDWQEDGSCSRCDETQDVPAVNPFVDVPDGIYFYDPVMWALENDITKGVDATHFGPDVACTRAQVVTFLWRAAGSPEPTSTENPFVDVPDGIYCHKAVLWALENGITKGIDETHFGADLECTRAYVVTFLYRAMGKPEVTLTESVFN
ncbi:MAG: S-layer homology domain-containing protein, partial [Oscillospiraceae bacterium]|nr:S-layer homology domain-containing protein [Oscillospiraceae bacterium]